MPDPLLERGLPSSVESERGLLGAILLRPSLITQAVQIISWADFHFGTHRLIYRGMLSLYQRATPIDFATLTDELRQAGYLEQAGGATYIASLIDGVPRTDSVAYWADIITQHARQRNLIKALGAAQTAAINGERADEIRTRLDHALNG